MPKKRRLLKTLILTAFAMGVLAISMVAITLLSMLVTVFSFLFYGLFHFFVLAAFTFAVVVAVKEGHEKLTKNKEQADSFDSSTQKEDEEEYVFDLN